jgi:hypothetical protein
MAETPFEKVRTSFDDGKLKVLKKYFDCNDEDHVRIIKMVRKKDMYEYTMINKILIYVPKIDFVNSAKDLVLEFYTDKDEHRKSNGSDAIRMLEQLANNFEPETESEN